MREQEKWIYNQALEEGVADGRRQGFERAAKICEKMAEVQAKASDDWRRNDPGIYEIQMGERCRERSEALREAAARIRGKG